MKLADLWKELDNLGGVLDRAEKEVRSLSKRSTPTGRVTPFFATKRFVFGKGDFSPQSSPLVQSADRVTRVTRLTYSVQIEMPSGDGGGNIVDNTFYALAMRSTARGMTYRQSGELGSRYNSQVNALRHSSSVFDFEWALSLGSSERSYAQRRDTQTGNQGGGVFMSRNSLGNPENDKSLLFSEKYPVVLQPIEFLTFTVRPTMSYLASPGPSSFTTVPVDTPAELGGRFVVNISCAGYRTFGDEVSA